MKKYLVTVMMAISLCMALSLTGCNAKSDENESLADSENLQDTEASEDETDAGDMAENEDEDASEEAEEAVMAQSSYVDFSTETKYFYESDEESGRTLASSVYELIDIESEDTPQLDAAIEQWNSDREKEYDDFYQQSIDLAKTDFAENQEWWTDAYTSQANCIIKRADKKVFSFMEDCYSYMGGAHGNSTCTGYNFDVETGKDILLTDVVNDISVLPKLLEEKLLEKYESDIFLDPDIAGCIETNYLQFSNEGYSEMQFIVGYEGITIFFNAYDLSYYAAGTQEITLLYQDYPDLLKPDYFTEVPESYAVQMQYYNETELASASGQGLRTISVYGAMDEYDTYETITVVVDGNETIQECYTYEINPYYVKVKDKSYLYIQMKAENDYQTVMIFDISGDKAVYVNEFDGHLIDFTNPESFVVEEWLGLLSNYGATRTFHVGDDGVPVCDSEDYEIDFDRTIISTVELEGEIIDAKTGEATGESTGEPTEEPTGVDVFPAGTEFRFLRTDNTSYVQMEASDGRIVRFDVTYEWPQMINGKEAMSCFEELWYSG
jgi:hypothetical protein